jgi:polyhydroxyalkanoate synthesis regulator protein
MREQMRATFGANPALVTFETMARTNMEWFQRAMTMFSPYAGQPKPEAPRDKPLDKPTADAELEAMKARLVAMQSQLDKISKGS